MSDPTSGPDGGWTAPAGPPYGPPTYTYPPMPYGFPPAPYGYPMRPPGTNGMAIASLVCALTVAPLGLVFGFIALSQIRRTGQDGRGLALAGTIVGGILTTVLLVEVVVVLFVLLLSQAVTY